MYRRALAEAGEDPALTATIHTRLAASMAWGEGAEQGSVHAELAVRASSQVHDVEIRCRALAAQGEWRFRAGRGLQREQMDEAVALERSLPRWPLDGGPTDNLARQLVWSSEPEGARRVLHELVAAHRARSDADGEATAIWWLSLLEWRVGDWEKAERHAAESYEIRPSSDTDADGSLSHSRSRGASGPDRGRAHCGTPRACGRRGHGNPDLPVRRKLDARLFDLSLGDAVGALAHLRRAYEIRNAFMLEPGQRIELGDLLEALIGGDELSEADDVLTTWEPRARAVDRAWALAILARCRGLPSRPGKISMVPSRALTRRSPNTLATRIHFTMHARCSRSAVRSGGRRNAVQRARRSRKRSAASSAWVLPSGPSRREPSSPASVDAPPRAES